MGKLVFVTGGARSGKSRFAEQLASTYASVCYVATAIASDDEMRARIEAHRARRPAHWRTVEAQSGIGDILRSTAEDAALIDCLTVLMSAVMLQAPCDWDAPTPPEMQAMERRVLGEVHSLLQGAADAACDVILVSNEVGLGLVPPTPMGRIFRDIAGQANALAAAQAEEAYFVVSGIPMKLK